MKLVVTILEKTFEAALDAIGAIALDHDAVELRAEELGTIDLGKLRGATDKPLILTHRGRAVDEQTLRAALAAGIELVDVEFGPKLDRDLVARYGERIVLSHHDYDGMPEEVENLANEMGTCGCGHVKIAVTPRTVNENLRLLALLRDGSPGLTVMGMGERGLYSRVLAPFRGSELAFVAPEASRSGAPGQVTLATALEIYGSDRERLHARHVFAIAGNPAGHSRGPAIHNALFRETGADAAYTFASFETFGEIAAALMSGELRGLSVTAPFKEDAYAFAASNGRIAANAQECGAANTLVRNRDGLLADNTDVDGFAAILNEICGRDRKSVAVIGAGGTARAALVAARRTGMPATIFNRGAVRAKALADAFGVRAEALDELPRFDGEIVINTLPPSAEVDLKLKPGSTYVQAAYGDARVQARCAAIAAGGVQVFDGLDLLRAQAIRQNEIFTEAIS